MKFSRFAPLVALCIAGCIAPITVLGEEPGRLFYTPAQRRELDARVAGTGAASAAAADAASAGMRLDGFVRLPGGRVAVWIDGRPRDDDARVVRIDGPAAVVRGDDGATVRLRAGERERAKPLGGAAVVELVTPAGARPLAEARRRDPP